MATQVQFRRGTSAWHAGFAGAEGEITVNTDDFALHVHDGSTAGGHRSGAGLPDIVTAGSATKVQVDVKGRVIARGDLTAIDLPDVPMDKIAGLAPTLAGISSQLTAIIPLSQKGVAGGVVPLNGANQIDPGYLPPMQDQTSRVQVTDDAARLLLPISAGFRIVEVLASGQKWAINPGVDPAIPSNWGSWADSAAGVDSFAGRSGAVTPSTGDYSAMQIASDPVGSLAATNVQAALAQLDAALTALQTMIATIQTSFSTVPTADQLTSFPVGTLAATNVQAALAELEAEKLGMPASLPIATAAEGDLVSFGDVSNSDTPARTTVGGLFTNRILTAPELRGYSELVAAAVSINGIHTMGGLTAGNVKRFILTGAVTLTLPTVSLNNNTGVTLSTVLAQDATGGRTVTFAAPAGETILWDGGGNQPSIATGAGQETTFSFYRIAGSPHWKGVRTHKGG